MKKILIILAVCLLFTGCTEKKTVITNENLNVDKMSSEVFDFVLAKVSDDEFYSIGSGITVTNLSADGKVSDNKLELYPVYADEELYAMVLKGSELIYINDLNVDERMIKNNLVIASNDNVYIIDESGEAMPLRKKSDSFNKKILDKFELRKNINNEFGDKRVLVKEGSTVVDPSSGRKFSSSRIVVKFTEGDTDKKIADFEEFCGGKLRSSIKTAGIYVFEIEASNYKKLSYLISEAKKLDYVQDVQLDEQREAH